MTVKELIVALQAMPQDVRVVVYEWDTNGEGTERKELRSVDVYENDAVIHHD